MSLVVDKAEYAAFVAREKEAFQRIKGESADDFRAFVNYQRDVVKEKDGELNLLRKKADLGYRLLSKEDMSEVARRKTEDTYARSETEIEALLKETKLRLRMLLDLVSPQTPFDTGTGGGEGSEVTEREEKGKK